MTLGEFRESQKMRMYALTRNHGLAWLVLVTLVGLQRFVDLLEAPSKHFILRSQRKYRMIYG